MDDGRGGIGGLKEGMSQQFCEEHMYFFGRGICTYFTSTWVTPTKCKVMHKELDLGSMWEEQLLMSHIILLISV